MVPLEPEVVHFGVALVAYTVKRSIIFRQLSMLVTACLTNGASTALAVLLHVPVSQLNLAREGSLTELAIFSILLSHLTYIERLRQNWLVQQTIGVVGFSHQLVGGRRHWHHHRLGGDVAELLTLPILLPVGASGRATTNWLVCECQSLRGVAAVEHGGGRTRAIGSLLLCVQLSCVYLFSFFHSTTV